MSKISEYMLWAKLAQDDPCQLLVGDAFAAAANIMKRIRRLCNSLKLTLPLPEYSALRGILVPGRGGNTLCPQWRSPPCGRLQRIAGVLRSAEYKRAFHEKLHDAAAAEEPRRLRLGCLLPLHGPGAGGEIHPRSDFAQSSGAGRISPMIRAPSVS